MGSIGVVELLILGFVCLAGVTILAAGVLIYALTRKQKQE